MLIQCAEASSRRTCASTRLLPRVGLGQPVPCRGRRGWRRALTTAAPATRNLTDAHAVGRPRKCAGRRVLTERQPEHAHLSLGPCHRPTTPPLGQPTTRRECGRHRGVPTAQLDLGAPADRPSCWRHLRGLWPGALFWEWDRRSGELVDPLPAIHLLHIGRGCEWSVGLAACTVGESVPLSGAELPVLVQLEGCSPASRLGQAVCGCQWAAGITTRSSRVCSIERVEERREACLP